MFSSLSIPADLVTYPDAARHLCRAMGDEAMQVLNLDEARSRSPRSLTVDQHARTVGGPLYFYLGPCKRGGCRASRPGTASEQ